jgi:hypothetical protein
MFNWHKSQKKNKERTNRMQCRRDKWNANIQAHKTNAKKVDSNLAIPIITWNINE